MPFTPMRNPRNVSLETSTGMTMSSKHYGKTVKELRVTARELGIEGYSRMKREELLGVIREVVTISKAGKVVPRPFRSGMWPL